MAISRWMRAVLNRAERVYATPPGVRIYAIGDVHGRDDLFESLVEAIEADLRLAPSQAVAVPVGDYVDRGPGSKAVIERLANGRFPIALSALRGNHEEMLLRFLDDPGYLEEWRRYGGLETLHAYGIDVGSVMRGEGYEAARDAFVAALPETHLRFLQATLSHICFGDYFFCHAGVRPGAPLQAQRREDLLWIRDPFLTDERPREKMIVHGHTPVAEPDVRANRINIDTGAFATSRLTCLVLEATQRRFLFAERR